MQHLRRRSNIPPYFKGRFWILAMGLTWTGVLEVIARLVTSTKSATGYRGVKHYSLSGPNRNHARELPAREALLEERQ